MSHRWVREMMGGKIKSMALCIARLMRIAANIIHETLIWHGQWGSSGTQHVPKVTSKHSQLLLSYEVPHVDKQSHQQTWCKTLLFSECSTEEQNTIAAAVSTVFLCLRFTDDTSHRLHCQHDTLNKRCDSALCDPIRERHTTSLTPLWMWRQITARK